MDPSLDKIRVRLFWHSSSTSTSMIPSHYIRIDYVLTTPWPEFTIDSPMEEFNAHMEYYNDTNKASKILFATMPPHLQEEFKDDWAFYIHRKLCKMFAEDLTHNILDRMNDPNEIACTHCCDWGHLKKNCQKYLQKLKDEGSNGFDSTSNESILVQQIIWEDLVVKAALVPSPGIGLDPRTSLMEYISWVSLTTFPQIIYTVHIFLTT
ncbi:hypothetical protein LXL04_014613 [Taraxacum kok-saghyz]